MFTGVSVSASIFFECVLSLYFMKLVWIKNKKACSIGAGLSWLKEYMSYYSMDIAVHRSNSDLCHHQAMFVNLFISYYASFFFGAVRLGFAAASEDAAAGVAFFEAVRFNFAYKAFFFLEFP